MHGICSIKAVGGIALSAMFAGAVSVRGPVPEGVVFGVRLGEVVEPKVAAPGLSQRREGQAEVAAPISSIFQRRREQLGLGPRVVSPSRSFRYSSVNFEPALFGVTKASVGYDSENGTVSTSVNGAFRRGLARHESLEKVERLREEVSRRVGFEVGEYRFSLTRSGDGVALSSGGSEVWMDMDTVFAYSVTTNGDVEVDISCSVNPPEPVDKDVQVVVKDTGLDSKIEFSVKVTKISLRDAELRRQKEDRERLEEERRAERAREEQLRKLVIHEFYGVEFGVPCNIPTNELVRVESEEWSTSGVEGHTNFWVCAHWERTDRSLHPAPFFDEATVAYSFDSVVPCHADFTGRFPDGVTREDSRGRLDAFAKELAERYDVVLRKNICTCKDQQAGRYYCRDFRNSNVAVSLQACDDLQGNLRVRLSVSPFDVSKKYEDEGLIREWSVP